MKTSKHGIDFIKSFENFSSTKYICPAGVSTIGYGHVIKTGENLESISQDKAEELLVQDLHIAENSVRRNIMAPLEQKQFDALVSFVFNLGGGCLQRSSLRQKINYGAEDEEIHDEFLRWVYAAGKRLAGLIRRREGEACMYLG